MKQYHLGYKTKLTEGLLILALFCSLFAFLGNDIYSQERTSLTAKTELSVSGEQTLNRQKIVVEKRKDLAPKRFFNTYDSYRTIVLIDYNRLIDRKIYLAYSQRPAIEQVSKFVQIKTIPIGSEDPHAASPKA